MNKQVKIIFPFCPSSHHGNSYQSFCMPFAERCTSQNLTQFENEKEQRSSHEGMCVGHSQARIATHPSSLQGNLKPSNFLLRHNQAFTSFQGTLKPSNFFLLISRGSCWRLLISMLSFSHNLFFLSTSQHENMETQNNEVTFWSKRPIRSKARQLKMQEAR